MIQRDQLAKALVEVDEDQSGEKTSDNVRCGIVQSNMGVGDVKKHLRLNASTLATFTTGTTATTSSHIVTEKNQILR